MSDDNLACNIMRSFILHDVTGHLRLRVMGFVEAFNGLATQVLQKSLFNSAIIIAIAKGELKFFF